MHALNDFNRKDLLDAIEQKKWCRIEYKRAAGSTLSTELLCMPLEIRSSVVNGREFLIFSMKTALICVEVCHIAPAITSSREFLSDPGLPFHQDYLILRIICCLDGRRHAGCSGTNNADDHLATAFPQEYCKYTTLCPGKQEKTTLQQKNPVL
jgi:hypothetical protein